MAPIISITSHTTASAPRPHILYTIHVNNRDGQPTTVKKRYSDFVTLQSTLGANAYSLPPKRILATTFIPSAWSDDALIAERKTGLTAYLNNVAQDPEFSDTAAFRNFLNQADSTFASVPFDPEDAIPSTLSRKAALELVDTPSPDVEAAATFIAASYYPDWSADAFPPEKLDFSRWDILFYAFATPSSSFGLSWDSSSSQSILKRLVTAAKNSGHGTKIVLSVGGWGGCEFYSAACTSSHRTTFVNALASAVSTFGLDGIDIDWEYPNNAGAGQPFSSSDSANLLSTITALRTKLGSSKIISAAVPDTTWLGSNGKPLTSMTSYVAQMTYVNIMNYDVWGASSTPGPNAPLGNLCGTSTQPQASAQAALSQWTKAGFPANKLLLGLPLYGYVSQSTKKGLTGALLPPSDMNFLIEPEAAESESLDGDGPMHFLNGSHARLKRPPPHLVKPQATDGEFKTDAANVSLTSWFGQQIPFSSIVKAGALKKGADGNYGEAGGFTMGWDDCSDTPFLFNTSQKTVVTYDDTFSLGDKAKFAKQSGMAGCFTWSLDQDDGVTLQNVIRKNLGKS